MGGFGSGGRRPGAGRKPKSAAERALTGWASHGSRTKADKVADLRAARAEQALPILPPPADLPEDSPVRAVWLELAPLAAAARTLTLVEAFAFRELCEAIAFKRRLSDEIQRDGITVPDEGRGGRKKHPLLSEHRGWQQRVDAGLARFKLSPMGREVLPPEPAKDEWSDFEDGGTAKVQ